jgi:hypothetical protein
MTAVNCLDHRQGVRYADLFQGASRPLEAGGELRTPRTAGAGWNLG